MDQIGPWHRDISFSGPTPVGGWINLTIFSNGAYNYSGHLRDSGAPSYNDESVWGVKSGSGTIYLFTHTGRMHGTFESGSRNDDWTQSHTNPAIAADWSNLAGHWSYKSDVHVNFNVAAVISGIETALKIAGPIIALA